MDREWGSVAIWLLWSLLSAGIGFGNLYNLKHKVPREVEDMREKVERLTGNGVLASLGRAYMLSEIDARGPRTQSTAYFAFLVAACFLCAALVKSILLFIGS